MTRADFWTTAGACILALGVAACQPKQSETAATSAAPASDAASAQPTLTPGWVQTASATSLTIATPNGGAMTFNLSPGTVIMVAHRGSVADIKAGDFLGTTNVPSADGAGQSTEVHIFPPGVKIGEGDRPMGPPPAGGGPASRMTNGDVTAAAPAPAGSMTNGTAGSVASGQAGVQMDVAYAGGTKHIVVPASTPVMVMASGTPDMLKPGMAILVGSTPGTHDATFINIQPAGPGR